MRTNRWITALLLTAVLALIVPFLYQCRYCIPNDDDFRFTAAMRQQDQDWAGTTFTVANDLYLNWQGCYLSNLCCGSHPYYYGGATALRATLLLVNLFFFCALYCVIRELSLFCFASPALNLRLLLYLLALIHMTTQTPYPEAFTWYPGQTGYVIPTACGFAATALLLRAMRRGRTGPLAAACVMFALSSSGTLGVAAIFCYGLLLLLLICLCRKRWVQPVALAFACAVAFALINALAPGYMIRRGNFATEFAPLQVLQSCVVNAATWSVSITVAPAQIAAMLLLIAVLSRAPWREGALQALRSRTMALLLPLAMLAPVVVLLPFVAAYNGSGVISVANRYLFLLQCVCAGVGLLLAAFCAVRLQRIPCRKWVSAACAVACAALLCLTPINRYQQYKIVRNTAGGAYELFNSEWDRIYTAIAASEDEDVVIVPYLEDALNPDLPISHIAVVNDPNYYTNQQLAEWFHKNTVRFAAQ